MFVAGDKRAVAMILRVVANAEKGRSGDLTERLVDLKGRCGGRIGWKTPMGTRSGVVLSREIFEEAEQSTQPVCDSWKKTRCGSAD